MSDNERFGISEQLDDTISRAAALNIAHELIIPGEEFHQNNQAIGNYTAELVKLPSAQAVAKDINVPVKDCISRATAIETVRKAKSIGQAHRMLMQLPSAHPPKEIPKRVLWTGWKGFRDTRYKCPNCEKPVRNDDTYCHRCGQRLTFPHISFTDYVPGQKQDVIVRWDDE